LGKSKAKKEHGRMRAFFENKDVWVFIKVAILLVGLIQVVPIMLWVERRGSALMQNRLGPNRLGPLGLFQALADVIKFFWKEDGVPGHVNKPFYLLAPLLALIPAFMTFAVIPVAQPITIAGTVFSFQVADLDMGLVYTVAIASLGVYSIIIAGWSSHSIYALMGSLRSSSQMISYELSMGLSLLGIVMVFGSVNLSEIASAQGQPLFQWGSWSIPKWGILLQPIGFVIFLTTAFAETNRLPFDLPEGESELIAGYHIEYGAMKFAMFMMAEYLNMTTACGLISTLYFGGWQLFPGWGSALTSLSHFLNLSSLGEVFLIAAGQFACFMIKLCFFMWFFVWVRWTLPRFRYDQLMELGWKTLLPLSIANLCLTAGMIALGWI
jgi:NADH-quinone oxidoreductase subunit H